MRHSGAAGQGADDVLTGSDDLGLDVEIHRLFVGGEGGNDIVRPVGIAFLVTGADRDDEGVVGRGGHNRFKTIIRAFIAG